MKGIGDSGFLKCGFDILFPASEAGESLAIICEKIDKSFPIATKNFYRVWWHVIKPCKCQAGKKKAIQSDFQS